LVNAAMEEILIGTFDTEGVAYFVIDTFLKYYKFIKQNPCAIFITNEGSLLLRRKNILKCYIYDSVVYPNYPTHCE
jgi:hypothetical protein